jgi:PAT family beta-lactamase induction signal transducer AmpG
LPAGLWKPTAGQRFISSLSWLPCRVLLLLVCRQTLEYTQRTEHFMPRTEYHTAYRFALRLLMVGCVALALWLVVLIIAPASLALLRSPSAGRRRPAGYRRDPDRGLLDFMALRKTQMT